MQEKIEYKKHDIDKKQTNQNIDQNKTINQWRAINNMQHIFKVMCFALIILCICLCGLCFKLQDKTPIVVKDVAGDFHYLVGSKKQVPLKKENIKRFISKFIELRYRWDEEFSIQKISSNISPFVTTGFNAKTVSMLKKLKDKDLKGKKLNQGITKSKIFVTEKSTTAIFDRVLRINGVPLCIPTQISFELVRGEVSIWNRLGLYINGVTIHEGL